jgi:hypothetical protein
VQGAVAVQLTNSNGSSQAFMVQATGAVAVIFRVQTADPKSPRRT